MGRLADPVATYWHPPPRKYALAADIGRHGYIGRSFALIAFAGLLAATIALNAFRIGGLPIRGLAAMGVLILAMVFFYDVTKTTLKKNQLLLALAAGLALLGVFVSAVNGASGAEIFRSVMEIHVQAAVIIIVSGILAQVAGARACMIAIVVVVAVSACVAVAQTMDVTAAWHLRHALGPLQSEETKGLNFLDRRAPGLSFSAIQLSTQICLAFAAFLAVRDAAKSGGPDRGTPDPAVVPALLTLFAASLAVATRSPILGGFIFLAAYSLQRRKSWLPLFLIVGGLLVYIAWPMIMGIIQTHAPRVLRTDDNSASARLTLVYYGWRLFADNPLGYGLTFQPMAHWTSYWPDLYMMPAPQGTRENELHNYLASMLNIYGIGIFFMAPLVVKLLRSAGLILIFFVPYVVQILFHNSGPFYNDNVIWFVVAAVAAASTNPARSNVHLAGLSPSRNLQLLSAAAQSRSRQRAPSRSSPV